VLSLIHTLCSSLQHAISLRSLLCLHQSLPAVGYQQCPLLLCSRSYRLATVPQTTKSHICPAYNISARNSQKQSQSQSQRQSQSYFNTGSIPPINSSWRQAPWDSRHSNFTSQMNTFDYSPYVTSSLTRGWVCRLQLLLVLASAVILKWESRRTHEHILLSQIRDSPNLEGQRNVGPVITPDTEF
jgi:hypothetical protein